MITTVSTTAELTAALKGAHGGDTIQLAAGNYSLSASYLNFTSNVTITSADASKPATLTSMGISHSSGLSVEGLELRTDVLNVNNSFQVASSSNIQLDHLDIHGSLDNNPQDDVSAMLVRDSSNVSVTNSTFHEVWIALGHLNDTGLKISNNTFHDIQLDGVRGGGSSNVTISGNSFSNWFPKTGDHPDAIQFWTTNTTTSAHDITVTDNVFLRGNGTIPPQGIFLGNELSIPYQHVTISGNLVAGEAYNGIAVFDGSDVNVTNNTVVGFTDYKSWIRLEHVTGGNLLNNQANTYVLPSTNTGLIQSGDTTIAQVSDGGAAAYQTWLAAHSLSTVTTSGAETLSGTSGADSLVGTAYGDKLQGLDGNDTLIGGDGGDVLNGGAGADHMEGGAGNDLYFVDNPGDVVVELAGGGVDKVQSSTSFTLPANVEALTLNGTANLTGAGNELNNGLLGNAGSNLLSGLAGDDGLNGAAGADSLVGGAGADTLTGGTGADVFVFAPGDGKDVITDFGAGGEHDAIDASAQFAAGIKATLTDGASGVTIAFSNGDSVLVSGLHAADLHATSTGWIF